nr:helix-turn-helix transcriptional regulator [Deltaproteobacteria bacterium]
MMLPLLLLRADAQVLRNALRPLVPEKDLGPVIDRLLANASGPDGLADLRSDLEARGEVFSTVLALQANGANRPADRGTSTPNRPAPSPGVRPAADGDVTQEWTARVVAELHRRATIEGWHTPAGGERGIVLRWPGDVAPTDVEEWLGGAPDQQEAERLRETIRGGAAFDWTWGAASLVMAAEQAVAGEQDFLARVWELARVLALSALSAHAFRAVRAAQRDRERPFMALDAGPAHHALLNGWRDLPKDRQPHKTPVVDGWAEILAPTQQVRLQLDVRELPERIIHAVRAWRGWQGLRHWAALHRLLTTEGRTGFVRWKLEAHMDALGYSDRARRDDAVRKVVADEVEALTRLELAIYHRSGELRMRGPVLSITQRAEAIHDSEWALEGLVLAIHPALYEGVRDRDGTLGSLWAPAPADLARIDHVRHPYALALGLILPIRWRWDLAKGRECVTLTGQGLLETAGIKFDPNKPGRAWTSLERDLIELQRVEGLGEVRWEQGGERTLAGRCHLFPPQWVRDRLIHHLPPVEPPPAPSILTGSELRAWRRSKGWTQVQTARALGVGTRSVIRAEGDPDAELGRAIEEAIARLSGR